MVHTLLKGLEKIVASADIPMLVCGDFNFVPGSVPHALLTIGKVDPMHQDLAVDPLGILRPVTKLIHTLPLELQDKLDAVKMEQPQVRLNDAVTKECAVEMSDEFNITWLHRGDPILNRNLRKVAAQEVVDKVRRHNDLLVDRVYYPKFLSMVSAYYSILTITTEQELPPYRLCQYGPSRIITILPTVLEQPIFAQGPSIASKLLCNQLRTLRTHMQSQL
uniref:Endonuclease/exonuclease/phosphatase domain-containing protein n=1 Tax=Lactuca sativa TaxID=4236 RepID=A0A9R1X7X4_LACSA|nr:hypothetical protein LSAT_V11C600302560 [Lactuca sativa]